MGIQSPESKRRSLIMSTFLLIFFIINEVVFRDIMYSSSLTYIENLQATCDPEGCFYEFVFRYLFSVCGDPHFVGPIFILVMLVDIKKVFMIKLLIYTSTTVYIASILKILYGDPRPYWVDQKIIPYEAYAEYGSPSGHSLVVTGIYGYLFFKWRKRVKDEEEIPTNINNRLIRTGDDDSDEEAPGNSPGRIFGTNNGHKRGHNEKKNSFKLQCSTILFVSWAIGVLISRSYLGMHTYNQVLLGATYGIYICYFLINYIDPIMDKFMLKLINREFDNKPLLMWSLGLLYVVASIIPVVLYIAADASNPIDHSIVWNEYWPIVQKRVGAPVKDFAYIKCFTDCSIIAAVFGALFGILWNTGEYKEFGQHLQDVPKTKIVMRVAVGAVIICLFSLPLFLIPIQVPNFILSYFFNENLALFFMMCAFFKLSPSIYKRFKLGIEGEFLQPPAHH